MKISNAFLRITISSVPGLDAKGGRRRAKATLLRTGLGMEFTKV